MMKRFPKSILIALPIALGIAFAQATPDESPCAVVVKSGKGSQVIPPQGKVQVHFPDNAAVACGSMVITHEEPFWIKGSDLTLVKIAPHSFVEVPKFKSSLWHLYRGELLVSAPPGVSTQTWSTPNSESEFKGGVAWIQYDATGRKSTVACFNRTFEFKNKFNGDAKQTVSAGEMSKLSITAEQVLPSQPVVMAPESVAATVKMLGLPKEDTDELVSIVKRVYDDRSKSLVSEVTEWDHLDEQNEQNRAPASVPVKKVHSPIDVKEADFVNDMLKAHLYGEDEPTGPSRAPASVGQKQKISDTEKTRQEQKLKQETKRIEKEIDRLNPDQAE